MDKKNYDDFIQEFTEGVEKINPNICFFLYGSLVNGNKPVYGRSDIDGTLILDSDIITPKEEIIDLSCLLEKCLEKNNVPTQFNLTDRVSNKDGRFLAYPEDYTDFFKQPGNIEICCGPDYVQEMNGLDYKASNLTAAAFNLRRIRKGALEIMHYEKTDLKKFRKIFQDALEKTSGIPKKLLWLLGDDVIPERDLSYKRLQEKIPDVDLSSMAEIDFLLRTPKTLFKLAEDTTQAITLYLTALEQVESMIKSYIKVFPEISKREVHK